MTGSTQGGTTDTTTRSGRGLVARLQVPGRLDAAVQADPGDVVAVIGPNGAGKTTLLLALAGLVPATGAVEVDGQSWTDPPRLVRDRDLGFVFQGQALFPHLTALANVAFGLRARGRDRAGAEAVAHEWLDRFGIGDLARRTPRELSGGQAQRVAIARALAGEPSPAAPRRAVRRARRRRRHLAADRAGPPPGVVPRDHAAGHPRRAGRAHAGRPGAGPRRRRHRPERHPPGGGRSPPHRARGPPGRAQRDPRRGRLLVVQPERGHGLAPGTGRVRAAPVARGDRQRRPARGRRAPARQGRPRS